MVISLETNEMAGKTMENTECFHVSDSLILGDKIYVYGKSVLSIIG